jgi:hypothetical protein
MGGMPTKLNRACSRGMGLLSSTIWNMLPRTPIRFFIQWRTTTIEPFTGVFG